MLSHTWNRCSTGYRSEPQAQLLNPEVELPSCPMQDLVLDNVAGDNDAISMRYPWKQMTSYTTNNVPAHQCAEKLNLSIISTGFGTNK